MNKVQSQDNDDDSEKILVQIIDYSDRILYNQIKEE